MNKEIYTLIDMQLEASELRASVNYDPAHAVFEGHFPGNPIVPGVCTLNMINDVVAKNIDPALRLQDAGNVKFLQLIRPADKPALKLIWKESEQGIQLTATLEQAGVIMMRFAGHYVRTQA